MSNRGSLACETTNLQLASFNWEGSGDSRFWGHALSPGTFLRLQTPGGVMTVCRNANVFSTTPELLRFAHLSQDMFITHSFGPKISVGTRHPGCVMNPPSPPALSSPVSDRRVSFLPFPPPFAPPCPSYLHASVLYFFTKKY